MGTSRAERKQRMFTKQARTVQVDGIGTQICLCPMCLNGWALGGIADLTVEDAPPLHEWERLNLPGTARRCLTCKRCNNLVGESYENRHGQYLDRGAAEGIAAAAGRSAASMCAEHAQKHYEAELRRAERGFEDQRRTELKSAYVIAFATLGWSYALDPILEPIRELIAPDSDIPLPANTCFNAVFPVDRQHVIAIETPLRFLLVTHPSLHSPATDTDQTDELHCIALPRPGGLPVEELYPALEEIGNRRESLHYEWLPNDYHRWSPSGHQEMHWDRCPGSHPRTVDGGVMLRKAEPADFEAPG